MKLKEKMKMDCVFCKIAKGDIPCMKVYEDEHTVVFMDKAKDADGHMVAITKKHFQNILDCDVETLNHLMGTVKKVSNHCVDECGYEGINLINTNGESAEQCVPHLHMHIIPRRKNDNIEAWPEFGGAKYEVEEIYEKINMLQ